jgi:hypothetical protein
VELLEASSYAVHACVYQGRAVLQVIDVKTIKSVVAMVPMMPRDGDRSTRFFLLEKPGLDVMGLGHVDTDTLDE